MFGDLQTKQAITQRAVTICAGVHDALIGTQGATQFQDWLSAQSDGDLTAAGFTSTDISKLRSAFADLNDLALKFTGSLGDGNHPVPYDYRISVKFVIGPG